MNEERDKFSYAVIGHAMAAHRELGPGLDEIFYHELVAAKLKAAGIPHRFKPRGRLLHREILADEFEADLIVGDEPGESLGVEFKVLWGDFAPDHFTQTICYVKFWQLRAALLLDFGKESLIQKRIVFTEPPRDYDASALLQNVPTFVTHRETLKQIAESVARVIREHGPGYRDTTYRGLLAAELQAAGAPFAREPLTAVRTAGRLVGEARLPCLVVSGHCGVLVTALRETRCAADRAVLQTCLKHLGLPWGLVINFGKRTADCHLVAPPGSPR